jgi:septal ring factor EnvC (AmiA/AmiB activator)
VEAWTDERLDDLAATLRPLPAQMARNTEAVERVTEELRSMRSEMAAMRADHRADFAALRDDLGAVRADLSASQRQIAQIGWAMSTALVGLMIALIIAAV